METPKERLTLTIDERIDEPGNIARLRLRAADGAPLPPFTAGAHLDVHIRDAGVDLWRQYSLCSDPAETAFYEIGVLRDPNSRGGSKTLHRIVRTGGTLEVEGPKNHFPLNEAAPQSLLFGGGIGVTPMIAMARRLHALGRDFTLHYCTRSRQATAFRDAVAAAGLADAVVYHHDDDPATRLDLDAALAEADAGVNVYVCGPPGFMDWVIGRAGAFGIDDARIHREFFSADVDVSGEAFEVVAERSGVTVHVGAEDTIAKALARAGVMVEVKCEEGVCGTCVTDVLDGEIDHRDHFLTADEREEGDQMCVCCSRARGKRLVLDL
ncbi:MULTISPECIES: PDR/VanB family oxidoreductase [unclassified Modicisalibacter]|uniref:PDR/VanB family oxidoreductase n=1 Tax=unclassified Modicisalibacter TaxID=2679913 RepID=UPI001CCE4059|nr:MULTISPECIES: PDR/VanB family oxidoreductase [unclassified Modicisalibacter]MBZ9558552.1 oxidoreductase [Modicisalibacter sp. R2A 31.J]MBZ9575556.1 oxidoreductase [Modicisalibacter sp. MOD 31.J]